MPVFSPRKLNLPKRGPVVIPADNEPINRAVLPPDVLNRRLEKCINELFDIAWSWLAPMELDSQTAKRLRNAYANEGSQQMAKELFVLHLLFDIMQQTTGPAMAQIRQMLEELKTLSIPKPAKVSLPRTRYDMFRRSLLRSMLNSLSALDSETGERVSFNLGNILFFSEDD